MQTTPPHPSDPVLEVRGSSKAFGATRALDDVSFVVKAGTVHALLGGNGSGKSTLIKALAGVQPADGGQLRIGGHDHDLSHLRPAQAHAAGLRFVHQQSTTFPGLTVAENLALGSGFRTRAGWRIPWRAVRRDAQAVLERFEVRARPDDVVSDLGPATRKMIEIARALQDVDEMDQGVLVLDEPTTALPTAEAGVLLGAVRACARRGLAIVYVTHRLDEVFAIADAATLLRDGRNAGVVRPHEISQDELVEAMMGTVLARAARVATSLAGDPVLQLDGFSAGAARDIYLAVRPGEVVGLAGLIGSGRSSLLKGVFGAVSPEGTVTVAGARRRPSSPTAAMRAGIAYVPEDRPADGVFGGLSVLENLSISVPDRHWRGGFMRKRAERAETTRLMNDFLVKAEGPQAPIGTLSGGNQQKVVLARWLRRDPRVLLLDEPTQGVDVLARAEIYDLIRRAAGRGAGVVMASSDFDELVTTCDRVVVLRRGRVRAELTGDALTVERINHLAHATEAA